MAYLHFNLFYQRMAHLERNVPTEYFKHGKESDSEKITESRVVLGLYSPPIFKKILCLFLRNFHIGI